MSLQVYLKEMLGTDGGAIVPRLRQTDAVFY
jgi:hypothetical protein